MRLNHRPSKPHRTGVMRIRGPYYRSMASHYRQDLLEAMGAFIDSLKSAGVLFALLPRRALRQIIALWHAHDVLVSTGAFTEPVISRGTSVVDDYVRKCQTAGFDIVELSRGFATLPSDDWLGLVARLRRFDLKPKPGIGIQFGASGAAATAELEVEGTRDSEWSAGLAKRLIDAEADMLMLESEGITENVGGWITDFLARSATETGPERLILEAADPLVFAWYIRTSRLCNSSVSAGAFWETNSTWGRILSFPP